QQRAIESTFGQVHHAVAAAHVDRVDFAQEGQRLVRAELAGTSHKGADIFGKAAAAEAQAGTQEFAADAVIVANSIRERHHVTAGDFADFRDCVDKRNLGGQKGIRGDFYQFRGL